MKNDFLPLSAMIAAASALTVPAAAEATPPPAAKPNIVLILADDMGYSDIGCFGSEIATPNLDRLAAGGLRFTQMHNVARCSPSRASLLTGLNPHQAGMGLNAYTTVDHPSYRGYLRGGTATIPEILRTAGYRTSMSGKWHIGGERPHWPIDRGFDEFFGILQGATSYWKPKNLMRNQAVVEPGEDFYMTDALSRDAVRFIKSTKNQQPFFLYLAYTAPHFPLHAREADIAKYENRYAKGWDVLREERHRRLISLGILPENAPLPPRPVDMPAWESLSPEERAESARRMAIYAAQVDSMDQGIGKVLQAIRDTGAENNTLVLFLSDNGASAEVRERQEAGAKAGSEETFLSYGKPWAYASNTPYRLFKSWVHEGGIVTPMIAFWPDGITNPGRIAPEVCHIMDIMPTCLAAAQTSYPREFDHRPLSPLEGRSLLPIFEDKEFSGHDVLCWEHEGRKAVRKGQWKAVTEEANGNWELYDLAADPFEADNQASRQPAVLADLVNSYERWAERCGVLPFDQVKKALDLKKAKTD